MGILKNPELDCHMTPFLPSSSRKGLRPPKTGGGRDSYTASGPSLPSAQAAGQKGSTSPTARREKQTGGPSPGPDSRVTQAPVFLQKEVSHSILLFFPLLGRHKRMIQLNPGSLDSTTLHLHWRNLTPHTILQDRKSKGQDTRLPSLPQSQHPTLSSQHWKRHQQGRRSPLWFGCSGGLSLLIGNLKGWDRGSSEHLGFWKSWVIYQG